MARLNFSLAAMESLERAKLGDYDLLSRRLRKGIATRKEQALAAEIIRTAPKPAAHRPRSYDNFIRNDEVFNFVQDHIAAGKSSRAAVTKAMSKFALGKSAIYAILRARS